jgi:hypothetical protein
MSSMVSSGLLRRVALVRTESNLTSLHMFILTKELSPPVRSNVLASVSTEKVCTGGEAFDLHSESICFGKRLD